MFKLEKNSPYTPALKVVCWVRGGVGHVSFKKKPDKCKFVPRLLSMIADSSKLVLEGQEDYLWPFFQDTMMELEM